MQLAIAKLEDEKAGSEGLGAADPPDDQRWIQMFFSIQGCGPLAARRRATSLCKEAKQSARGGNDTWQFKVKSLQHLQILAIVVPSR